jgi:hypothetical protein
MRVEAFDSRQRVRANGANVLGEGEVRERLGRLGCVAVALMLRFNAVGDFHGAVGRRPFEAAASHGATGIAMHDGKPVQPRINGLRSPDRGEPLGRNLGPILRRHCIDHCESVFSGLQDEG